MLNLPTIKGRLLKVYMTEVYNILYGKHDTKAANIIKRREDHTGKQ